jgi:hypothetical protein
MSSAFVGITAFAVGCIVRQSRRLLDRAVQLQSKPAVSLVELFLCLIHFRRVVCVPFPFESRASEPGFTLFDLSLENRQRAPSERD